MPRPLRAAPESRLREAKGRLSKCTHSGRSHHLDARLIEQERSRPSVKRVQQMRLAPSKRASELNP